MPPPQLPREAAQHPSMALPDSAPIEQSIGWDAMAISPEQIRRSKGLLSDEHSPEGKTTAFECVFAIEHENEEFRPSVHVKVLLASCIRPAVVGKP